MKFLAACLVLTATMAIPEAHAEAIDMSPWSYWVYGVIGQAILIVAAIIVTISILVRGISTALSPDEVDQTEVVSAENISVSESPRPSARATLFECILIGLVFAFFVVILFSSHWVWPWSSPLLMIAIATGIRFILVVARHRRRPDYRNTEPTF